MRSAPHLRALLVVAIAASPFTVRAQTTTPALVPASAPTLVRTGADSATLRRISTVKSALRNLVTAQEQYYSEHGSYTTDLKALGFYHRHPMGTPRTDSVGVQVAFAGGRGWTGVGQHIALRGKSCAIYVGFADEIPLMTKTAKEKQAPTDEGAPLCDQP